MSCGVGRRCGSDPALLRLWLWHRPVATAPIQPLAWEPPYAAGAAQEIATHEDLFKGLKVEKVVIPLPEEDQVCPVCGTQMVLIGEEYVRRELEFIPATCKVIEYYSHRQWLSRDWLLTDIRLRIHLYTSPSPYSDRYLPSQCRD